MEFGNCLRRIAIVAVACSWTELLVELYAHVIKFYGLMFCGFHSTAKNAKITPLRKYLLYGKS